MGQITQAIFTIDSDSPSQQIRTILHVGDTQYDKALNKVHEMMQSPNPDIRWACIHAIADLKNPDSVPLLKQSLKDSNRWVRATSISALAKLRPVGVVHTIVDMLDDSDSLVVIYALQALVDIHQALPSQAIVRVGQLLNDDRKVFEQYGETVSNAAQNVLNRLDNLTSPPEELLVDEFVPELDLGDEEQWIRDYIAETMKEETTQMEPVVDTATPDAMTPEKLIDWIEKMVTQTSEMEVVTVPAGETIEESAVVDETHSLDVEDINDHDEQLADYGLNGDKDNDKQPTDFDLDKDNSVDDQHEDYDVNADDSADEAILWLENLAISYGQDESEDNSKTDDTSTRKPE